MAVEIEFDDVPTAGPSIDDIEFDDPTRQALSYGSARDPDKHAHLVSIADRERLPVDMVERNQAELEKRSAPRPVSIDDIEFDSPVTTGALADPDTAAMSHDDLDNLSALERIYRKQQAPKTGIMEDAGKAFQRVEDEYWSLSKRLHSAVKRANLGMMAGVLSLGADFERSREEALIKRQAEIESGERRERPAVRGIPGIAGEMTIQEKLRQAPKTRAEAERSLMDVAQAYADVPQDEKILEFSALVDSTQEKRGTAAAMGEGVMYLLKNPSLFAVLAAEQVTPAALVGGGGGAILGGVASKQIANRIVSQAAKKYVERSVTMAGVQFGSNMAMTYGPEIAQGLNDGLTVSQAISRARNKSLAESGANAAFAFIPTAGGRVAQILIESAKQGVAGAAGAAVGAAAVGEDITLSELMLEGFGEITSVPVDLAFTGMPEQQQRIQRMEMKEGAKILQGSIDQMKLDELVEVAKRNKLGDRNGERFNSFFQTVRDTYGEQQVFIDGDEVAGVIDDMDPNLPGVQEMRRQLQQGGDISLPIDVYVADIARTEVGDTIRPHVRMDAEGLSQIELQEATPQMEERIRQMMERADIEAQDIEAADTLTGQIFDQLMETGRVSRQVARMQSALIPAAVSARAKEYGVTFDEMAQRLGFGGVVGPHKGNEADLTGEKPVLGDTLDVTGETRKGHNDEYDLDVSLEQVKDGYVISESDPNTRDKKVSSGIGGIYLNDLILNMEGAFVSPRDIVQGGTGAVRPESAPFKPDAETRDYVMKLVAEIEFARLEGDMSRVDKLEDELVRVASGVVGPEVAQAEDAMEQPQQDPDIQALAEFSQQPDEYQFDNFEVRETAINNLVGRLVPDDQFTGMQMPTGSGFVSITPSAKEPGSWQVTQFDEAGQPTGDGGIQTKEEALRDFFSEARPDLAGESSVLNQARVAGYEGDIKGEAEAWLNAQRKGLDMSQEARMERARAMGFDVDTPVYHGTTYGEIRQFMPEGGKPEGAKTLRDFLAAKEADLPFGLMRFREGTFFSPDPDYAGHYTGEYADKGLIYPAYLKIENPAFFDMVTGEWSGTDPSKTPDALLLRVGDEVREVAVIDPSQIRSIHAAFDPDSAGSADILAQQRQDAAGARPAPRAEFDVKARTIHLLESSDPSSFIHEAGHLFLEFEKQLSDEFGMTARQQVLLDWLGVDSFDKIKRDQHEQFARGFEAYAFEGKSPSRELVPMFSAFRRWLIEIYKKIRNLDVMLTPEIRDFFDHMLATDEQIAEMQANPDYDQFFVSIEQAGMTQAEWDDYQERQAKRAERATNTLEQKILARLKRKYTKEWQDELVETKDQARSELMEQDVYRAVAFLRGDLVIDGQEGNKMDRARVNEILGLAPPKEKPSKDVDTEKDTLLVAIAKLGGIDRQEAEAQGIDPENWKGKNAGTINQPIFGKRIFGLNGQSFDAMRETLAGYNYNFETANLLLEAVDSELRGDLVYSDSADYDLVFGMREDPETKPLPRSLWGTSKKGGLDPDQVALDFGFRSGDEMLQAISNSPELHVEINRIAQERMIRKHGDILNDGTIEQEARSAAQNEEQGKVLLQELRALNKQAGARQAIDRESLKIGAAKVIAEAKISDINPQRFYRAEVKSAQKAAKALADGDIDAARMYKTQQLANHYLYKEASQAKDRVVTMRKYLSGVRTRKFNTKQVDAEYVHQMKILAAAYDFKAGKRKEDQAKQSLLDLANWINEQMGRDEWIQPQFMDPTLSEMIAIKNNDALDFDEKTKLIQQLTIPRYSDMTMEQLQGAYDMVRNLRYVGGRLSASEAEAFKTLAEEVADNIRKHGKKDVIEPDEHSPARNVLRLIKQFGADHVALANRITEMDGYENFGPFFRAFYQGILDSTNRELVLKREVHAELEKIFSKFKRKELAQGMFESGHAGQKTITLESGKEWSLSRRGRLMLGLYWGTPESRIAIMEGHQITEVDAMNMISTLNDRELDFVQGVWELNESIWPQIRETALKMTGVSPPKTDHVAFTVRGRTMPGGHMRLYYMADSRDTFREDQSAEASLTRSGGHIMKSTAHGTRNERVGSGGRRVDLDLNNIFAALDENLHDIAFAETIRDSHRFLSSKAIRNAITEKYGREIFDSIVASVSGIARGNAPAIGLIHRMMRYLRMNSSLAMLGYSIRNMVQQPVAVTNVFAKIGEKYTMLGMVEFVTNPMKWKAKAIEIQAKSEFMKQRTSLVNRETAEIANRINSGLLSGWLKRHAFDLQTMGDAMIAYPAWHGAYLKGLNELGSEKKAIAYADQMVAQTIGSGLMKDMSPLMQGSGINEKTGSELLKSLTFMGSFFNVVANLTRDAYKSNDLKTFRGQAEFTRQMAWLMIIPAVASALLVGDLPDADDDEGWLEWAGKKIAEYGLAQIFIVRDLVYLYNGFTPSTPYTRAIDQMSRTGKYAADISSGEREIDAALTAKLLRGVSAGVPIPGAGQAARTIEGMVDASEGSDRNIYTIMVEGKDR